jgi:hypothetical protein
MERATEVGRSLSLVLGERGSGWRKVSSTTTFWARVLAFWRTATRGGGRLTRQLFREGRRETSAGEEEGLGMAAVFGD